MLSRNSLKKTCCQATLPQVLKATSPDQQVTAHLHPTVVTAHLPPLVGSLGAPVCLFGAADVRYPEVAAVLIPLLPKPGLLLSVSLSCYLLI